MITVVFSRRQKLLSDERLQRAIEVYRKHEPTSTPFAGCAECSPCRERMKEIGQGIWQETYRH